ncbi:MAG: Ig-like domain-containing protein [Gemmatimonadetes bacterium]|nr:Ig-like domain-containing protein [Gemmatimonadota bacterium]
MTISPATAAVEVPRTVQLTATLKDDKGQVLESPKLVVSWSSADAVAMVDTTGLVKAAGIGTTRITASIGTASGTADITGLAGSVSVSPAADTLEAGSTAQLTATVRDADGNTLSVSSGDIGWGSSDAAAATVNATGLVSGVAPGSATITASAGGKSGSAAIIVTGPAPTISSASPSTGTVGTELTIKGTHFRTGAQVLVDTLTADSVDVVADTVIFALVPSGVVVDQKVHVTVRNADGTSGRRDTAFTAVAPRLQFVNSATKPSGKVGSTVILEGNAFGDLRGVGKVLFSDGAAGTVEAAIASEDDWTNTFIVTTVPSGTGTGDLVVATATGTSNALTFTVTSDGTFSPSEVDWLRTSADLPTAVSGHAAVAVPIDDAMGNTVQYVHITGGASNNQEPRTDVQFGVISATGDITAWTATAALPEARAFHASVAATPFNSRIKGSGALFTIGGIAVKDGQPVTGVTKGTLNADGTVASWTTATPLPVALHSARALLFRGFVYVAGGATTDHAPVATLYRAAIDTLGEVGTWEELTPLPAPRSYHGFGVLGACLFGFSGEGAAVDPNSATVTSTRHADVIRSRIDLRTGLLTAAGWVADNSKPAKARLKHTGVIAGGGVLLTAGLYDGIGTLGANENEFAQIAADCEVDSFGGASNDKSIRKKTGGANLFNHAAISYIDASGVAHVMIIGGDDVDKPGSKRVQVWYY